MFQKTRQILNVHTDAILPRKGPITRTMSKRLQEDWARAAEEGPRVLMSLRVDFGPMG